ncbi:MAG: hypothetical protein H7338_10985, partial [Candidatus Sericytochromatia bacterium]|nr:hypothetical protein [Candidatus Sericytochromatia bacterium]
MIDTRAMPTLADLVFHPLPPGPASASASGPHMLPEGGFVDPEEHVDVSQLHSLSESAVGLRFDLGAPATQGAMIAFFTAHANHPATEIRRLGPLLRVTCGDDSLTVNVGDLAKTMRPSSGSEQPIDPFSNLSASLLVFEACEATQIPPMAAKAILTSFRANKTGS